MLAMDTLASSMEYYGMLSSNVIFGWYLAVFSSLLIRHCDSLFETAQLQTAQLYYISIEYTLYRD